MKEIKDAKDGVALMLGANASGDFTILLFVLLIVTIFVSVLGKISDVLSGLPLTIFPASRAAFNVWFYKM